MSLDVKRFRIIAALLLLAIWVPITSHELLEHWGLIHEQSSNPAQKHDDDHDAADGVCQLPGWNFPVQRHHAVDITFLLPVALADCLHDGVEPQASFVIINPSPPDIPVGWQFSSRAALPARAPSSVS